MDNRQPRGYVPFNVQAIGNDIVVTYALHQEGSARETDGPGLGYVNIYTLHRPTIAASGSWRLAERTMGRGAGATGFWRLQPRSAHRPSSAGGGTTESSGYIAAYDIASRAIQRTSPGCRRDASRHQWNLGTQSGEREPGQCRSGSRSRCTDLLHGRSE